MTDGFKTSQEMGGNRQEAVEVLHGLYERVASLEPRLARAELADVLGVENHKSAVSRAVGAFLQRAEVMPLDDEASATLSERAVRQAVDMLRRYPFLIWGEGNDAFDMFSLDCAAGNHLFDDHHLLFGLTENEGHEVRHQFQTAEAVPGQDFYASRYTLIIERFDLGEIPHNVRHP